MEEKKEKKEMTKDDAACKKEFSSVDMVVFMQSPGGVWL